MRTKQENIDNIKTQIIQIRDNIALAAIKLRRIARDMDMSDIEGSQKFIKISDNLLDEATKIDIEE
jgi:hypothetical protein